MHWRAMSGPRKEVFFPQQHEPGARGLSDFTDMAELRVTITGVPFARRLYHFVLAFSRWEYANVVGPVKSDARPDIVRGALP
jgi:hypothetical protein